MGSAKSVTLRWDVASVLDAFEGPPGYQLAQAPRGDVPALVTFLAGSFPEIAVSSAGQHLQPAFYAADVHLGGTTADRPFLALVARHGGEIVAALTLEKRENSLAGGVGAVALEHRSLPLGLLGPRLLEAFGRAMGAELLEYYATLKSRHQQVIAERLGFLPVGIVPASDRSLRADGDVRRVYEILYAKVLAPAEWVQRPSLDAMTPRTRALYKQIFG